MDLGAILDRAGPQISDLLATSGCTVHLRVPKDRQAAVADPATLVASVTANSPYASSVPAVVAERPASSDNQPARPARVAGARVVIGVDTVVKDRTEVVVATCRDARLVGRVYAVTGVTRNVAGIVTLLDADTVRGA